MQIKDVSSSENGFDANLNMPSPIKHDEWRNVRKLRLRQQAFRAILTAMLIHVKQWEGMINTITANKQ